MSQAAVSESAVSAVSGGAGALSSSASASALLSPAVVHDGTCGGRRYLAAVSVGAFEPRVVCVARQRVGY